MKRWEAWWNHAALAAVSLDGRSPTESSSTGCPARTRTRVSATRCNPWMLKAHLLVAPSRSSASGCSCAATPWPACARASRAGGDRGAACSGSSLPLALSGYLIQVFVAPGAVRWTGWIHAGIGVLFVLGYAFHPKRRATNGNAEGEDGAFDPPA